MKKKISQPDIEKLAEFEKGAWSESVKLLLSHLNIHRNSSDSFARTLWKEIDTHYLNLSYEGQEYYREWARKIIKLLEGEE